MGSVFGVEMHFAPTEGLQMGQKHKHLALGKQETLAREP